MCSGISWIWMVPHIFKIILLASELNGGVAGFTQVPQALMPNYLRWMPFGFLCLLLYIMNMWNWLLTEEKWMMVVLCRWTLLFLYCLCFTLWTMMRGPPRTRTLAIMHMGPVTILVSNPVPFQNNACDFGEGVQDLTHAVGWPVFQTKIKWLFAVQKHYDCWKVSVYLKWNLSATEILGSEKLSAAVCHMILKVTEINIQHGIKLHTYCKCCNLCGGWLCDGISCKHDDEGLTKWHEMEFCCSRKGLMSCSLWSVPSRKARCYRWEAYWGCEGALEIMNIFPNIGNQDV
jgi:hypothetical protein